MARPASSHPTDGELEILQVLWEQGPLALSDLCARLRDERDVATTTVATMLRVMHGKQLVRRTRVGRGNVWSAAVTRQKTARNMVGKLVDRVFDGSAHRLAAHLVEAGKLSDDELAELRKMIHEKQTSSTGKRRRAR